MSFDLVLKEVAIRQAATVFTYYSRIDPMLGERFIAALEESYRTLRRIPHFEVRKTPYRYLKLRKFPYRLIFEVNEQQVVVYQIKHTKRKSHPRFGP